MMQRVSIYLMFLSSVFLFSIIVESNADSSAEFGLLQTLTLSDNLSYVKSGPIGSAKVNIQFIDALALSDNLLYEKTSSRKDVNAELNDMLTLSDNLFYEKTGSVGANSEINDALTISDNLSYVKKDAIGGVDATINDALTMSDNLFYEKTGSVGVSSEISDALTISDNLSYVKKDAIGGVDATINDVLTLSDNLFYEKTGSVGVNSELGDALTMSDNLSYVKTDSLGVKTILLNISDNFDMSDSITYEKLSNLIIVDPLQTSITISEDNTRLFVTSSDIALNEILILDNANKNISIDYSSIMNSDKQVFIKNGFKIKVDLDDSISSFDVEITIPGNIIIQGPPDWNGIINLPTFTPIALPGQVNTVNVNGVTTTTTIAFDEITSFLIGLDTQELSFSIPIRIQFTDDKGTIVGFFKLSGDSDVTFINTECLSDSILSIPTGSNECSLFTSTDFVIWTKHFTSFGDSSKSVHSTSSGGGKHSGGGGGSKGSGGSIGGIGGAGGGGSVSRGILTLYEVSWNFCDDNLIKIVTGPKDSDLSVKLRTRDSKVVKATLSEEQIYDDKSVYESRLDKNTKFVQIQIESISGKVGPMQESLDLNECKGSHIYEKQDSSIKNINYNEENWKSFEAFHLENTFEIKYQSEGLVTDVQINQTNKSVSLSLSEITDNVLIVNFPSNLIDAVDGKFVIMSKQGLIDFQVLEKTSEYTILKITLPEKTSEITVMGTKIIPEFEYTIMIVLLVSIIIPVFFSKRSKIFTI